MKKFVSFLVLGVILGSLVSTDAEAQRFTKRRRYASVGVSLNAMNYFGDIVPEADFTSFRFKSTRPTNIHHQLWDPQEPIQHFR